MEKKIEISEPLPIVFSSEYYSDVLINGEVITRSFANTKEQAQSNARIAASGYLVEELVEALEEARKELEYHNWQNTNTYNKIVELLTKATNTK